MKSNPKKKLDNLSKQDSIENKQNNDESFGLKNPILDKVKPIIKKLPPDDQATLKASMVALSIEKSWSGPLPSPASLKEYNNAFPNGAEKIFNISERQSEHRMDLEKLAVASDLKQSERGQLYGLIIALAFFIGAFILIWAGHDIPGTILGSVDLVALVSVFVIGKNHQRKDLKEKSVD